MKKPAKLKVKKCNKCDNETYQKNGICVPCQVFGKDRDKNNAKNQADGTGGI